jgi:hypothetical protein
MDMMLILKDTDLLASTSTQEDMRSFNGSELDSKVLAYVKIQNSVPDGEMRLRNFDDELDSTGNRQVGGESIVSTKGMPWGNI